MRVLIINWRSIGDPFSGGAEKVTYEHAKRWVKNHNAEIFWISPVFPGCKKMELIDGIVFHRIYPRLFFSNSFLQLFAYPLFYLSVFFTYLFVYKKNVDVVVDQVHGLPYLTPLYVKEKVVVYIHEVAGKIWDKMFPPYISFFGKMFETLLFKLYKTNTFVCVSNSTKNDLVALGIDPDRIEIINNGISLPVLKRIPNKSVDPIVMFLNRLVPMKGPEDAISAFYKVSKIFKDAKFIISGRADPHYLKRLRLMIESLGMKKKISIYYLSEMDKVKYLKRSWAFVNTSIKEGWGLVNLEANSQGTFVIAYKTQGNVDSIKNGKNGFLCSPTSDSLAETLIKFLSKTDRNKYYLSSIQFAKKYDWEVLSNKFYGILTSEQN